MVVYKWNYNECHHQKLMCTFYIYKKQKNRNIFNTKSQTLCKQQDNFCYVFNIQKKDTLRYTMFHEIFEVCIYIQKAWHFVLCEVFIYKKLDTSQTARQFTLRFYKQNPDTLRYAIFHWIFEIGGGGGHFYMQKTQLSPGT